MGNAGVRGNDGGVMVGYSGEPGRLRGSDEGAMVEYTGESG